MWIILSLTATLSQVTRNLFSKKLTNELPIQVIVLSRFIYALPIILLSYIVYAKTYGSIQVISKQFYIWVALMGSCQILATYFRISLFKYKSFAVSLTIVQIDTIITAFIGLFFLREILSITAWGGVLTATSGLILASLSKNRVTLKNIKETLCTKSSGIALITGLFLALAAIFAKQSFKFLIGSNSVGISLYSLLHILIIEVIILFPISIYNKRTSVKILFTKPLKPIIIGTCSGIGSFCWLTAYSLTHIAYVRTVGQLEFIFATLISIYYLKEKLYKVEFLGMVLVVTGSLILIFL